MKLTVSFPAAPQSYLGSAIGSANKDTTYEYEIPEDAYLVFGTGGVEIVSKDHKTIGAFNNVKGAYLTDAVKFVA